MKKGIKEYKVAEGVVDGIPVQKGTDSNLKKYMKRKKTNMWFIFHENVIRFFMQVNVEKRRFAGYMPEPYILFLNNSKNYSDVVTKIEMEFKNNVVSTMQLSESYIFELLHQDFFNFYLNTKISSLLFLIMSVETFLNNIVPDNFILKRENDDINKINVERNFKLKEKLRDILPQIKEIEDLDSYYKKCSRIYQLNDIRNSFVHLKTASINNKLDPYLADFEKLAILNLKKEITEIETFLDNILNMKNVYNKNQE